MGGADFFSLLPINLNKKFVTLPEEKVICVTSRETVQLQNADVHEMPPRSFRVNPKGPGLFGDVLTRGGGFCVPMIY